MKLRILAVSVVAASILPALAAAQDFNILGKHPDPRTYNDQNGPMMLAPQTGTAMFGQTRTLALVPDVLPPAGVGIAEPHPAFPPGYQASVRLPGFYRDENGYMPAIR